MCTITDEHSPVIRRFAREESLRHDGQENIDYEHLLPMVSGNTPTASLWVPYDNHFLVNVIKHSQISSNLARMDLGDCYKHGTTAYECQYH